MEWKADLLIDVTGWLGAISLLAAYGMVSARRVDGASLPYQLLNLAGGVALIVNTVYHGAYPSAFVNLIWIGIAIYTLTAVRQQRRSRRGAEAQKRGIKGQD